MPLRPRVESTDDWHQIDLLARAPGQRSYELIRPVVLFGQSPAERAAETGAAVRTVYRQAARFDQLGLAGLLPPPKVEKHCALPPEVRQAILDAKREHPPLNTHELTTICWARFGHRPSSHTVKRVLAESPPPPRTHRRFRPYHAEPDPIHAAWRSSACTSRAGTPNPSPPTWRRAGRPCTRRSNGGPKRNSPACRTSRGRPIAAVPR
jgi:hypothetical protein